MSTNEHESEAPAGKPGAPRRRRRSRGGRSGSAKKPPEAAHDAPFPEAEPAPAVPSHVPSHLPVQATPTFGSAVQAPLQFASQLPSQVTDAPA